MTKNTNSIDWMKAERFYCAGVLSNQAIADKCGCSRQALHMRSKKEGWSRDLAPRIRQRVKRKLGEDVNCKPRPKTKAVKRAAPEKQSVAPPNVSAPVATPDAPAREALDEALVEAAAREIVSVTQAHRVEAARLIDIARDLGGKLADLVHGRAVAFEAKTKDGSKVRIAFLGEHESAADALGKVTRALKHLVDIERKAFAMDEDARNPEKTRHMVPLEERLATYRREEAVAEADNVVEMRKTADNEPPPL